MSSIDRNLDALGLAPHPDAHEELPRYELETIQMFGSLTGASLTWLELKQLGFKLDPQWKSTSQSMLESTVSSAFLVKLLEGSGLQRGDARLTDFYGKLRDLDALEVDRPLTLAVFDKLVAPCRDIIYLAISGDLSIPDFSAFGSTLEKIYSKINEIKSGANASYIPQLAQVNPEQFGISVTTVSGQHLSIGDSDVPFCIQSCSKPLSYLMALGEHGSAYVHRCVGTEPSGQRFNEMVLKDAPEPKQPSRRIPHNPMINAGAMMMCSMLSPKLTREERLEKVLDTWRALTAGAGPDPVGYDDATYQSESATADRNWCLAYMMKESGAFPPCFTSLSETLELYFQICSILCTSRGMSVMAATLANGGLNPITGERVFAADDVRRVLPLMLTCGMYDFSGQWAFDVGLPAKSGVGGCVFMVIPNVCGIAVWSPRLDPVGNSVRAVAVAQELCRTYALHNFEVFSGLSRHKVDLSKRRKNEESIKAIAAVLFAASHGDVRALRSHHIAGMDIYASDYDQRTALHIAAAAGHVDAVEYLVKTAPAADLEHIIGAKDRWGFTPLHEAENFDRSVIDKNGQAQRRSRVSIDDDAAERHGKCVAILKEAGAKKGLAPSRSLLSLAGSDHGATSELRSSTRSSRTSSVLRGEPRVEVSKDATFVVNAAAEGDLEELVRLAASGLNLGAVGDYDFRTALHLSASNGHAHIVRYLLSQGAWPNSADRFGNTPLSDAIREGHDACKELLTSASKAVAKKSLLERLEESSAAETAETATEAA